MKPYPKVQPGSSAQAQILKEAPYALAKSGGVVKSFVPEPPHSMANRALPASKLVEAVREGLPIHELDVLQQQLGVPLEKLAGKLGISKATLHRRKAQGKLAQEESDRVVRFARLWGKTVEVLEDEDSARQWLNSAQIGLGGALPLDYAETEIGAREVEDLLGRIDYGVYS